MLVKTTDPIFPSLFDVGPSLIKTVPGGTSYYSDGSGTVTAVPAGRVPVQLSGGESDFDFAFRNAGIGAVAIIAAAAGATPVLSAGVRSFAQAPPSPNSPMIMRARARALAIKRAKELLRARAASIRAKYYRRQPLRRRYV